MYKVEKKNRDPAGGRSICIFFTVYHSFTENQRQYVNAKALICREQQAECTVKRLLYNEKTGFRFVLSDKVMGIATVET